jgi:epoxyqueuosine reductase
MYSRTQAASTIATNRHRGLRTSLSERVKGEAERLGFLACGIAAASPLAGAYRVFEERIMAGVYAGLPWFTLERARRSTDPGLVLREPRSVIVLAALYSHAEPVAPRDGRPRGKIARYAWGRDYHRVLEKKLRRLCSFLEELAPGTRSRPLVDYGPLAERAYAERAGLGWFGKNTNLLVPGVGSWVLLAEVVTTAELEPDTPLLKSCGACRRCIDACPTKALSPDGYLLDNERCISYQTIENRGPIPRELRPLIGDWLFGCDICQEVCPVGRRSQTAPLAELDTACSEVMVPALIPLLALGKAEFRARFAGRAIMRAKRDGLLRNACVVLGNLGDPMAVPALSGALGDESALVRGHAAWALGRLGGQLAHKALCAALASEPDPWVREEVQLALHEAASD